MAACAKIWRHWRFALIAAMGIAGAAGSVAQASRTVTMLVFNLGLIPDRLLAQAEKESQRILAEAGVSMVAINCRAEPLDMAHPNYCQRVDASTFLLRVESKKAADRSPDMLGYSLLFQDAEGPTPAAGVFYPAARDLAEKSGTGIHQVLGAAIAHEVCHLLVGERHSAKGIMRARWGREELGRVRIGELFFSKDEAARMQAVLARPVEKGSTGVGGKAPITNKPPGFKDSITCFAVDIVGEVGKCRCLDDQIPLPDAAIELLVRGGHGADLQTGLPAQLQRLCQTAFGDVVPSDIPALSGQVVRISASALGGLGMR